MLVPIKVAIAAPIIPNTGISTKFNTVFITATIIFIIAIFCLFVIDKPGAKM